MGYLKSLRNGYCCNIELASEDSATKFLAFLDDMKTNKYHIKIGEIMVSSIPNVSTYNKIINLMSELRINQAKLYTSDCILSQVDGYSDHEFDYMGRMNTFQNLRVTKKCHTLVMDYNMYYSLQNKGADIHVDTVEIGH